MAIGIIGRRRAMNDRFDQRSLPTVTPDAIQIGDVERTDADASVAVDQSTRISVDSKGRLTGGLKSRHRQILIALPTDTVNRESVLQIDDTDETRNKCVIQFNPNVA